MTPRHASNHAPTRAHRVRLFNKGDTVSDEAKRAKLKRESRKINDLSQLIYWSDVGREGARHFEQLLQQKKMAQNLNATISGDISVEKAQKMIAKAIEVQKRADAARAAKAYKASSATQLSRDRQTKRRPLTRSERQQPRPSRQRQRGSYGNTSRTGTNRARTGGRSGTSKRSHSGNRA